MAIPVQQIQPVAHLPFVLDVLRRLEVATVIDRLIPPRPAYGHSKDGRADWHSAAE